LSPQSDRFFLLHCFLLVKLEVKFYLEAWKKLSLTSSTRTTRENNARQIMWYACYFSNSHIFSLNSPPTKILPYENKKYRIRISDQFMTLSLFLFSFFSSFWHCSNYFYFTATQYTKDVKRTTQSSFLLFSFFLTFLETVITAAQPKTRKIAYKRTETNSLYIHPCELWHSTWKEMGNKREYKVPFASIHAQLHGIVWWWWWCTFAK